MKKFTQIFLIFFLSVLFLSGCSQSETQIQSSGSNGAQDINIDGQISEDEYRYSLKDSTTGLTVYWSNDDTNLYLGIKHSLKGWVAVGFNPSFAMKDANIILMAYSGGQVIVRDDYGTGNFTHQEDLQLGGTSDLGEVAAANGAFELAIPLNSGDQFDQNLEPGNSYKMILAAGNSQDFDSRHSNRSSVNISLD